jgi:hypothetical protein
MGCDSKLVSCARNARSAGFLLAIIAIASPAWGYYLDAERRFDVRLRAYSQLGILTENSGRPSEADVQRALSFIPENAPASQKRAAVRAITPPRFRAGDLAQHRNFYNPEFDANLTDFMRWAGADQFKFRFAWWGFYDGLYDYLDDRWAAHARSYKTRFSESNDPANESYKFDDHWKRARAQYAHQNRINELYFDYTNGPFFIRVGKQAISWGESDTIAILDVSNPFDLTLGAPGFFQDVEEARIPLWTIRSTYKLIDTLGPLTSLFSDIYFVPGVIDTTTSMNPITAGVSPFNPDQADPHFNVLAQGALAANIQTVLVDRIPDQTWGNSRWGARLTGVLFRDYTVQGWFFRTFNQQPVPLLTNASAIGIFTQGRGTFVNDRGQKCDPATASGPCTKKAPAVTILDRRLESVIGLSATWFSQPVNGILKWEIEYFIDELAVIPDKNLNARIQLPRAVRAPNEKNLKNSIPTADYVRWVIGYDRNFFVPWLNPTNSVLLIMSFNNSFNLSEKGGKDYRNAYTKPGHTNTRNGKQAGNPLCPGGVNTRTSPLCVFTNPHDYEDAYQWEGLVTTTLRSDYLHGKLLPQVTMITDISGVFGFAPSVTYRITDNLLVGATYLAIAGDRKAGLGVFRAHDMLQLRVTGQFN